MGFHWQCRGQPYHPQDMWTSHPWIHCCPWQHHKCRAVSDPYYFYNLLNENCVLNMYLLAIRNHPELTSALTLDSKLILRTECVQLPRAYIVWVPLFALPYTVVQIHCYNLCIIILMWNYNMKRFIYNRLMLMQSCLFGQAVQKYILYS